MTGRTPNKIEFTSYIEKKDTYLCHINIGRENAFMIIAVQGSENHATSHILFDIGAEYIPLTYSNLSTGYEGNTSEAMIASDIPNLMQSGTPAAILTSKDGTYIQTYQTGPDQYDLEYQLVSTQFHFKTETPVSASTVIDAFQSYAFGKYEWAKNLNWVHSPL